MAGFNAEGKWRQTRASAAGEKTKNTGGIGCLAMLLGGIAMLFLMVYIMVTLIGKTAGTLERLGQEPIDLDLSASSLEFLNGNVAVACAALVMLAVLLYYIPQWQQNRTFAKETQQLAQNIQGEWDERNVRTRTKAVRAHRWTAIAMLLMLVPVVALPLAQILPDGLLLPMTLLMVAMFSPAIGLLLIIVSGVVAAKGLYIGKDRKGLKQKIVTEELNRNFTNVSYRTDAGFQQSWIRNTNLVRDGNRYRSNDLIAANYNGVSFQSADVVLHDWVRKTKDNEGQTIRCFGGRWLTLQLPKQIDSEFYLWNPTFPLNQSTARRADLQKVQLEDIQFGDTFSIRATDPHDVFYLITPTLLVRLKTLFGLGTEDPLIEGLAIYCTGNMLHLAIDGMKDAFEIGHFDLGSEQEIRTRMQQEVSMITEVIDALRM